MLGRVPRKNLSSETVRTWFASLGSDHPTRNAHAYQLLHAVLKTALTDGLLTSNPANLVGVMNPKAKRQAVIPTVAEVEAIADAIKPERLRVLVLVLAWNGLRWGEAIELRREDIAEGCKAIRVSRAVTHRRDDSGYCRIDSTKSGERRTFDLRGQQIVQRGAVYTVALRKDGADWLLTAWAWAKGAQ